MLVLIWTSANAERERSLATARAELLAIARTTAERQDQIVQEARNLLRVLVRVPAVTGSSVTDCHELLQVVADDHPRIKVLTITDAAGTAICNSLEINPSYHIEDRAYFRELMVPSPPNYVISRLVWGRGTNQPVIIIAVPLAKMTMDGLPAGIALASLNLDWLPNLSVSPRIADGRSMVLIDSDAGAILATDPGNAITGAQSLPEIAAAAQASPFGGVLDVPGPKGAAEVFGFAELPAARGQLIVAVALSREMILGGADRQLKRDLALGLTAAIVTALLAYAVAHLWLLRPINKIVVAIREVGRGNRSSRITSEQIPVAELQVLATTINVMVDEIEARDKDLRGMHLALAASEQHHRELADNVTDMISRLSPEFERTYVSPSCKRLLGFEPEELIGQAARGIVHADDWPLLDATLNAPLRQGADESSATYRAFRKNGSQTWLESSSRRLPDGSGFVVVTRDISERKRFETALEEANARLEVHARQDALTGLANRRSFDEALQAEWERSRRDHTSVGLILADIDLFKPYNDTLGHQAGDECLRIVGKAFASVQRRPGDVVARYGGEEFAVILPNTDLAGVAEVGERILQVVRFLQIPHPTSPTSIVTLSVGAASSELLLDGLYSPVGLLQTADTALYQAKRCGRNTLKTNHDLPSSVVALG